MTRTSSLQVAEGFQNRMQKYYVPDENHVKQVALQILNCYRDFEEDVRNPELFIACAERTIISHYYLQDGPKTYVTILIEDNIDLALTIFGLNYKLPGYNAIASQLPLWPNSKNFIDDTEATNFHHDNVEFFDENLLYQVILNNKQYIAVTHVFRNTDNL